MYSETNFPEHIYILERTLEQDFFQYFLLLFLYGGDGARAAIVVKITLVGCSDGETDEKIWPFHLIVEVQIQK